jgi:hypothetical protein
MTDVKTFEQFLRENFHLEEGKEYTEQEILDMTFQVMRDYREVLKNCGIIIHHAISVFESMSERGAYPQELVPDTPSYKGRQGFQEYKIVMNQVWPVMAAENEKLKKHEE